MYWKIEKRHRVTREPHLTYSLLSLLALIGFCSPSSMAQEQAPQNPAVQASPNVPQTGANLRPPIMAPEEKPLPTSEKEMESGKREKLPGPKSNANEVPPPPSLSTEEIINERVGSSDLPLRGVARTLNVETRVEVLGFSPLSRYRGEKLVFVRVRVKNNGDRPMLVIGNKIRCSLHDKTSEASGEKELEARDNRLLSNHERFAVALVGVGSAGLAAPIFNEMMTPSENGKRDLGLALGRDRGRHEVEGERIGTRLLMPGDDTVGWVAFDDTDGTRACNSLFVPVMFSPYNKINAALEVPVDWSKTTSIPLEGIEKETLTPPTTNPLKEVKQSY